MVYIYIYIYICIYIGYIIVLVGEWLRVLVFEQSVGFEM
jgi:hypothetical protein